MEVKLEERIRRIGPDKFLGKIHHSWAQRIIKLIEGRRILEVGCGYGFLTDTLRKKGFEVYGIDLDQEAIDVGRSLYPQADIRIGDAYHLPFTDNSFDAVIFHEVLHHLDLEKGLREAYRVARKCMIIFDPNPNALLKMCRKLVHHQDPEAPFEHVIGALQKIGCKITDTQFSDLFAMPLSGGFVGPKLCPDIPWLHNFLIYLDNTLCQLVKACYCERFLCWRYLIKAEK